MNDKKKSINLEDDKFEAISGGAGGQQNQGKKHVYGDKSGDYILGEIPADSKVGKAIINVTKKLGLKWWQK